MDELIQNVVVVVDVNASIRKLGRVKCRIKGDSSERSGTSGKALTFSVRPLLIRLSLAVLNSVS